MAPSPAQAVIQAYYRNHDTILVFVSSLTDQHLAWHPTLMSHSIAFHLWHIARWADYMQAAFPGMTPMLQQRLGTRPQIWLREHITSKWGFQSFALGYAETGMDMPDAQVTQLPFPAKATFLAYVQQAFQAVKQAVGAIDDEQFQASEQSQPLTEAIWGAGTVGDAIIEHLMHDSYHFGIIRSLHSLQSTLRDAQVCQSPRSVATEC